MTDNRWRTAITEIKRGEIRVRGYDIVDMMGRLSFSDAVFLVLKGELPTKQESEMMRAILVSGIDHGATPPSVLSTRNVLSGGNPYFLLWWATIGLTLATTATSLGIWAFALFAIVHWLCDLIWHQALSWASFKGTALFGPRVQRIVLLICSLALFVFGVFFIYNASRILIKLL